MLKRKVLTLPLGPARHSVLSTLLLELGIKAPPSDVPGVLGNIWKVPRCKVTLCCPAQRPPGTPWLVSTGNAASLS